ncbi:Hypp6031 [Branchiostoma lanceolatum]|uniref:Hypp6031 protein n=1 Tax=Branchiostoma lanceolatum TaxID=7740 RepID=A0A8J9W099_BRALA|nr:Hypp6031 [Branchiostoma lanceolatum]
MTSKSVLCLMLLLSTSCTVHVSAETCAEVCENCLANTEVTQDVFINGTACTEECEKNIHLGTDNKQFIRAPMWKKCYRLLHELRSKKGPYLIHDVQPVKANWQPAIAVSAVTVLIVFIIITMVTIKLCVKREILRTDCSRPPANPNGTIASTALMENMAEEGTQKAKQDLI